MSAHVLTRLSTDNPTSDDEHPAKVRRISRACLQCRARKQRCLPSSLAADLQAPCKRCQKLSITCSFETDRPPSVDVTQSPSRLAQLVVELHAKVNHHEARIRELERDSLLGEPSLPDKVKNGTTKTENNCLIAVSPQQAISPSQTVASRTPGSAVDGIDLGAPIATLRSLGALATDESKTEYEPASLAKPIFANPFDPISQGLLSVQESQRAIDIFFQHCHSSAPVLDEDICYSWNEPGRHSPTLILAICSVGTRFWNNHIRQTSSRDASHPSFNNLTKLLDKAVSRLLLRPTPSDVTLDSIRVLLLYAQWMPSAQEDEDDFDSGENWSRSPSSRYNEISAWAVLGLALRYATLLGLERSAIAPFREQTGDPSKYDVSRLRVWYNLLTCNFNLMLTSGLPTSVDPTLSVQVAQSFSSHSRTQYPGDVRVTALVELVGFVYRAMCSCGDISGRRLRAQSLQKLNKELDSWESASLAPLLSAASQPPADSIQTTLHQPLEISATAAAQMILSLSSYGADYVWRLDSQNPSSFPDGPLHADPESISRLYYAVDSTWISYTFAATFLIICYMRGIIDENLQICPQTESLHTSTARLPSSSCAILTRLLHLVLEIFDGVCPTAAFHFARDFQGIVRYATSLVITSDHDNTQSTEEVNELAFQSLLEFMNDSGVDWAGSLLGETGDFTDWNMNRMFAG
ncbi:hypothetical protein N7456_013728 [Penicillium angulare]|uniref:Zn(2)-C6 fungal-type domain-containing protein n=1 Tax=Penicillium angulare TaxID=116970 RepID=A0A9W9EFS5_9EURO|nr:hypothetical protein N7456_013728 [Penicillium angulare]